MIKIITVCCFFILLPVLGISQARLMVNDAAFLVLDNAAYLVIDNSSDDAITITGTGGGIVSENEANLVKWNIGTNVGTYSVPFSTAAGDPLSIEMNITTAGVGAGHLLFSTYSTDALNSPYPSDVTNMTSVNTGTDNSAYVMDRFYIANAQNYSTRPDVNLSFTYLATEAGASVSGMSSLRAQRFNPIADSWEGHDINKIWGTSNGGSPSGTVSGINISGSDFYSSWALVDEASPLPVELLYFTGVCEGKKLKFNWATASEMNNDYFIIEYSPDGENFEEIARVEGAGISSFTREYDYTWEDAELNIPAYFRLRQVDFDGRSNEHPVIAVNPCEGGVFDVNIHSNGGGANTALFISSDESEYFKLRMFDASGRHVFSDNLQVRSGITVYQINRELATGMYHLTMQSVNRLHSEKIVIVPDF